MLEKKIPQNFSSSNYLDNSRQKKRKNICNVLKLIQKNKEKHAQGFETLTKKKFNKIFV